MSESLGGYLILLDEPKRAERFASSEWFRDGFTDALSSTDWPLKEYEVCGFIVGQTISHWALAKRGKRVASDKVRVHFTRIVEAVIPLDALQEKLPEALATHFASARSGAGGRVPPATWEAMKRGIDEINPRAGESLRDLESTRDRLRDASRQNSGEDTRLLQRDSLGLALEIFDATGKQRKYALESTASPPKAGARSVLEDIPAIRLIEDQAIAFDASVFPGSTSETATAAGRVFRIDDRLLEVINVNRTSIERALGVDLLYYHHDFAAWTLVQYKLLEEHAIHPDGSRYFRPDRTFLKELRRMNTFARVTRARAKTKASVPSVRLSSDGFFFKFSRRLQAPRQVDSLLPGEYMSRRLVRAYLRDPDNQGSRGGRMIKVGRSTRHINNTLFAALVREGWIGTRGTTSDEVSSIVRQSLASRHSVMIARSGTDGDFDNIQSSVRDLLGGADG